uniref:ORF2 n=1 Tax=Torque teno Leptonychotes weddellii virus-1 TaxID=2012676 RepID=A0A1Z2RWP7_9VIRU|nr:ORF2 [Torque teno Leptonychotes weddellii virus 1]
MAHCQSKTPVLYQRRRVVDSAATTPCGDPDLHHPLQYRKQEALWKLHCSLKHKEFCACPNFLDHFKWPTGGEGEGIRDVLGGEAEEGPSTGENTEGVTMGGEGDLTDSELLQ